MKAGTIIGILAVAILASGCGNLNSIGRRYSVDAGESLSIDAKQRTIYTVTKTYPDKQWRAVCAEPSPDAIAAISASAGLSAEQLGKAIGAAFSSQESAGSIGLRTQTIQILRDAMYRLCEGYASGAMDEIGFTRLQRRYQNIMLGLLAIEQLTGAVVAKQVILTGSAEASVARSLAEIQAQLDDARKGQLKAEEEVTKAKTEKDAKDEAVKTASKAHEDASNEDKAKTAPALDKAKKEAALAGENFKTAEKILKNASQTVAELAEIRKNLGKVASQASTRGEFGGGGYVGLLNAQTATTISATVKEIVGGIVNKDYSQESCLDGVLSRDFRKLNADQFKIAALFCSMALQKDALQLTLNMQSLKGQDAEFVRSQRDALAATAAALVTVVNLIDDPKPAVPDDTKK